MKYCPDLTTVQWNMAMMRGNGDYQSVNLHECIKEKCVAYEKGMCRKYMNKAYESEEEVEGK